MTRIQFSDLNSIAAAAVAATFTSVAGAVSIVLRARSPMAAVNFLVTQYIGPNIDVK